MPGPKYVNDFQFPKDFGFTGSAGQVSVRPHTRQRFAKGGKVSRRPPLKPSPEQVLGATVAAGAAAAAYDKLRRREASRPPPDRREGASAVDAVRGKTRRQREQDLGLKRGGKVRRSMKDC